MKHGRRFNQRKNIWNVFLIESPILEGRRCPFSKRKKELIFYDLAGPVKKMAIPQHGPQHKLTNHAITVIKYQDDFQIKATTKLTHL